MSNLPFFSEWLSICMFTLNTGTAHLSLHRLPGGWLQRPRRIKTRRPLWQKQPQLEASMTTQVKWINCCGYSAGLMDKDTLQRHECHLSLQELCSDNIWWFYCSTFINPVNSLGDSTAAHLDSSAVKMKSLFNSNERQTIPDVQSMNRWISLVSSCFKKKDRLIS